MHVLKGGCLALTISFLFDPKKSVEKHKNYFTKKKLPGIYWARSLQRNNLKWNFLACVLLLPRVFFRNSASREQLRSARLWDLKEGENERMQEFWFVRLLSSMWIRCIFDYFCMQLNKERRPPVRKKSNCAVNGVRHKIFLRMFKKFSLHSCLQKDEK